MIMPLIMLIIQDAARNLPQSGVRYELAGAADCRELVVAAAGSARLKVVRR